MPLPVQLENHVYILKKTIYTFGEGKRAHFIKEYAVLITPPRLSRNMNNSGVFTLEGVETLSHCLRGAKGESSALTPYLRKPSLNHTLGKYSAKNSA